ncbi:MAG: sortase [Mogibacterium sp.]|nr:sortase [Mogibacterium sp.]
MVVMIAFIAYNIYSGSRGDRQAKEVVRTLEAIIPGLGIETDVATGLGRDPLASVSIDGIDIVGVLEIPSLNVMAPVMGQTQDDIEYFTKWLDGSPVKGHFSIIGGRDDVFRKIASLKPGDRVTFTDVDGVRYGYEVITQYHLKKWDVGDNELLICYESDSDTYFVVGCSMILSN